MNKTAYLPTITINNKKEQKTVEIDGEMKEVEITPKQGFNIEIRNEDKTYTKEFFTKDLQATILDYKYEIRSKYEHKQFYVSNEFDFAEGEDIVRVYAPHTKEVLYEDRYEGLRERFSIGEKNSVGKDKTSYDLYIVLYILVGEKIYKFKWKVTANCNWFSYKKMFDDDKVPAYKTIFDLEKKKFGGSEFWVLALINGDVIDTDEFYENRKILREYNASFSKKNSSNEDIKVDKIPF